MADKFLYILNNNTQNYPFCRLKLVVETFELSKPTNENSGKIPKIVKQTNKKTVLQIFGGLV